MRKLSIFLAVVASSMIAAPAIAHPEDEFGGYATRRPSTAEVAQEAINQMVAKKQLPATWTAAKLVSFDVRTRNGIDQYVLMFENTSVKQAAKRKLYVIMSTSSRFISASHRPG